MQGKQVPGCARASHADDTRHPQRKCVRLATSGNGGSTPRISLFPSGRNLLDPRRGLSGAQSCKFRLSLFHLLSMELTATYGVPLRCVPYVLVVR
jgi:hypothetical protein